MTQGTTSCPKWPGRFTARHHRAARAVNTSMNYEEQGKRMVMVVVRHLHVTLGLVKSVSQSVSVIHHRAARAVNTSMNYEEQGKRMVMVEARQGKTEGTRRCEVYFMVGQIRVS